MTMFATVLILGLAANAFGGYIDQPSSLMFPFQVQGIRVPVPGPPGNEPVYEPFRNGDFGIVAVANLSPDVTEANLFETFSNAGYVNTIKLCRDQLYRKSLGYGYVIFSNSDEAERAVALMNLADINGFPMKLTLTNQNDCSAAQQGATEPLKENEGHGQRYRVPIPVSIRQSVATK